MSITITPHSADDPEFVSMIERTVVRLDQDNDPAWYASFRKTDTWKLDRTKGVAQDVIESLTGTTRVIVPFKRRSSS